MKIEKNNIIETGGGVVIMSFVFLFLVSLTWLKDNGSLTLTKILGSKQPSTESSEKKAEKNDSKARNIISGKFNTNTGGNITFQYKRDEKDQDNGIKYQYKAINVPELKSVKNDPTLKLEIDYLGMREWREVQWSWIDRDQGIIYFHFKTIDNGQEKKVADFTGNYQVILND